MEAITYPLIPLRGICIFPHISVPFDVGREKSLAALSDVMGRDQYVVLCTQKDIRDMDPGLDDLYEVGTLAKIMQVLALPGDNIRVMAEGISRVRIQRLASEEPFLTAEVTLLEETDREPTLEEEAIMRSITEQVQEYSRVSSRANNDTLLNMAGITSPGWFADLIAYDLIHRTEDKQEILGELDVPSRLMLLMDILKRETDIQRIEKRISNRVRGQLDRSQKEYYLREQIKAIQTELGDKDAAGEVEELRERAKALPLSEEAQKKVQKELDKLARMQPGSPDASVSRNYVDWILDLPWGNYTQDNLDLGNAEAILNEDHFGLEKVKNRVLEYLAVRTLKQDMKGPILCFVGPPGTGKTSIARSIARAIGRAFVRTSLGGLRDEAEIRGHRRTYIGAIPGAIIYNMKQAGTMNPVFLFDEIDKMSSDFRGDPASAMLEVLDPEQNSTFRDHYLELEFDLSKVMFLATANSVDTIPRPLLDRMEIIEVSSYTEEEKVEIAQRHLVKKQSQEHGIQPGQLTISKKALTDIVRYYTAESGVRNLERTIARVCRKAAREIVDGAATPVRVTGRNLGNYLGVRRYLSDEQKRKAEIGVATGLAWTSIGGTTLSIEVSAIPGSGKLQLTGQLGGVMKESAQAGLSYIRSRTEELDLPQDFAEKTDIHIHIPEGAVPKDGPSAGITMVTAMVSALSRQPVRGDLAMTGEVTLRGRVLPVGGIKEKMLAAHRMGIEDILLPKENLKDLEELPAAIRDAMSFTGVEHMDQVLKRAIIRP
ncbi:endopeptidase La [Christensenella sp. MSJ-20]|uniref:endopeptidase La n=1 Tax=Christensenella sp. MSJ-20 TaxID=2841518 RepID=UPI001C784977|nr:endopeptidase La [Christensenella sp. MSJ-20]